MPKYLMGKAFRFLPKYIKSILEEQKNSQIEILRGELRLVIESLSIENANLKGMLLEQDYLLAEFKLNDTFFLDNKMVIHQSSTFSSDLHRLSEIYGSDKGGDPSKPHPYPHKTHNYVDAYEMLFSNLKIPILDILECGIGTNNQSIESNMGVSGKPGASLRMWSRYFPKARIVGVDIDQSILFEEPRIRTFHMDQTSNSSIHSFLESVNFQNFDIIIDDGLHNFESNKTMFENLNPFLRAGGVYIIEDVAFQGLSKYKSLSLEVDLALEIICLERRNTDLGDNNLVIFKKKLKL